MRASRRAKWEIRGHSMSGARPVACFRARRGRGADDGWRVRIVLLHYPYGARCAEMSRGAQQRSAKGRKALKFVAKIFLGARIFGLGALRKKWRFGATRGLWLMWTHGWLSV